MATRSSESFRLPQTHQDLLDSFSKKQRKKINSERFAVLGGSGNPGLSRTVGELLGVEVDFPCQQWPDGEINTQIHENVRGRKVIIFNSLSPNPSDGIMETIYMASAAKLADSRKVSVVNPYYPGRQDRKDLPRKNISAADIANLMVKAGVRRMMTVDLHAEQTVAAVTHKGVPWDIVYGSKVLVPEIQALGLENICMVAPDAGSVKRTKKYMELVGAKRMAVVFKDRDLHSNGTDSYAMIGDVKDANAIIADDEIATGGTMLGAARMLKEQGAKSVIAVATHGKFTRDKEGKRLPDRLLEPDSPIDRIIVTDTIDIPEELRDNPLLQVASVAPILATAVACWLTRESLSERLIK